MPSSAISSVVLVLIGVALGSLITMAAVWFGATVVFRLHGGEGRLLGDGPTPEIEQDNLMSEG